MVDDKVRIKIIDVTDEKVRVEYDSGNQETLTLGKKMQETNKQLEIGVSYFSFIKDGFLNWTFDIKDEPKGKSKYSKGVTHTPDIERQILIMAQSSRHDAAQIVASIIKDMPKVTIQDARQMVRELGNGLYEDLIEDYGK